VYIIRHVNSGEVTRSGRIALIQVAVLIALFFGMIALFGSILAETALHPHQSSRIAETAESIASATRSVHREVQITAADGTLLNAWLFLPLQLHPNYAILLHGVGDNRSGMHRLIRMLLRNNYAVLAPDSRLNLVTYGVREAGDVHAWADYLYRTQPVKNLYGLGESMGASVLLQSLPLERRFEAVVAECPFSTFGALAHDRVMQQFGTDAWPVRAIAGPAIFSGLLYGRIQYGVDLAAASPLSAVRTTDTPILLIHGLDDTKIYPQHSRTLLMANPRHVTPWFVPKAGHTGAFSNNPAVFEERVTTFFQAHER
jgi:dipeptidyl aminopeptidase/acylaminoacyl peptidase